MTGFVIGLMRDEWLQDPTESVVGSRHRTADGLVRSKKHCGLERNLRSHENMDVAGFAIQKRFSDFQVGELYAYPF
jgi:hypothetical protein